MSLDKHGSTGVGGDVGTVVEVTGGGNKEDG